MIRDIFEYILSFLKSRLLPMIIVFGILFIILISRLFNLQIINGQSYVENVSSSIEKKTTVAATRGRIFDKNGVLLAYNELAYSIKISDSGTYTSNEVKNPIINDAINKTIDIIQNNGDKITNDFPIIYNESGNYEFTISREENESTLLKFLRDIYQVKSVSTLTDEQKNATAQKVIDDLTLKYGISDQYSIQNKLEIINLRRYMSANFYNRYITFTIAYEVSDATVAAILENSNELVGVVVEEEYVRKYVDSVYTANILGYTGIVSRSQIEENNQYSENDVVGKSGIEESMDSELQGTKGSKNLFVDTVGRITEVLDETEPVTGNDVYLTIDIELQKKVYNKIEDKLVEILTSKIVNADRNVDDKRISYKSDGTVDSIMIPIKTVYFALIDNNLISLNKIAQQKSDIEGQVYNTFLGRQSNVIPEIESELTNSPTVYDKLSEEKKEYVSYIEKMLKDNGIINNVDDTDATYQKWYAGSISLEEYLTYAITKNWIDISKLTSEQYSSLQEGYNSLCEYIINKIQTDTGFQKIIYKYLVDSGNINGRQLCLILFEQGVLAKNDADYAALNSGGASSYDFIMSKIRNKEITPAQLALEPCSGSCVITNPNTGDVLALVSYPSYDNNKLSGTVDADYYNLLRGDKSLPLVNGATTTQTAPGSIFKPCSAITGLEQGIITPTDTFNCSGVFTLVTPSPKCWQTWGHGAENVSTAIRDSCNVFFYNVGYRLALEPGGFNDLKGTSTFQKYAEELGLATKSNIEIYEKEPKASNILSIASAIGQGNHNYSCLNLGRYVSTLATSGINHNLTLVDKITDSDGNLIRDNSAEVANTMDYVKSSTWDAVHTGMRMVIQTQAAFNGFKTNVAGKSGTAQQKTTSPDHATFISYAPYEKPEVAMSVVIPNGYTSGNVAALTAEIYKIYGLQ